MIVYFTGTGNSKDIAIRLSEALNESRVVELRQPVFSHPQLDADGDMRVIWVFPVYSWGVPPVVEKFISEAEALNGADQAEHHLVMTCGDDVGMTDRRWRRLIESRGWKSYSASSIMMPNTYVLMSGFNVDSKKVEQIKLDAADSRVSEIAVDIETKKVVTSVTRGAFPRFKSHIIRPWFVRHDMSPKPFHHTDACIGCMKCGGCPMANIEFVDRRPVWGDDCALCLRCYHICPVHAVAYGKATKNKGQYINKTLRTSE